MRMYTLLETVKIVLFRIILETNMNLLQNWSRDFFNGCVNIGVVVKAYIYY